MTATPRLGIIGGSGLYHLDAFESVESVEIDTPFGRPSSAVVTGRLDGVDIAFISRHGVGHSIAPSDIPYQANVFAMKSLGVTHLVSISAVGSLREDVAPGTFVIPDQIIDRTTHRTRTFFGAGIVAHVSFADPFCASLARHVADCATAHRPVTTGGTYVCIEGPQFSTRAESNMYRSWGGTIIGMTAMPEARLAREAELCYACLAMVTDWDVWRETHEPVSVAAVLDNLRSMTDAVQLVVASLAHRMLPQCEVGCDSALEVAIATDPAVVGPDVLARLRPIAGRYLDDGA